MKKLLSALAVLSCAATMRAQTIVTVAGNGTAGYTGDGVAATATSLNQPYGVCMDSMGNFFIGDYANNRIRKITSSGIITTLAGTGTAGFNGDGLDATLTQLNGPYGMSVNNYGSIIIADRNNHRLRIIQTESGGVIYTIAGTGVGGFSGDGGPAVSAQVNHPQGAFRDKAGNVYFCDDDNYRVRKIDASGIITTIAGNGTAGYSGDGGAATAAKLNHPAGVTKDTLGNIYIAEFTNHVIRKVSPSGIITTICGDGTSGFSGDGGPASAAKISFPKDVYVDQHGNILFSDGANQRVRKITPAGIITTIAGTGTVGFSGDGGPATAATFNWLQGVFVANNGDIYIGDCLNHRIRKIICTPPVVSAITGIDSVCAGNSATLASATAGGVWVSSNGHATISTTGVVTGTTPGTDTISYVVGNDCTWTTVTHVLRITTPPVVSAITGMDSVCVGHSTTLASATAGGVWVSSNAHATIGATGVVTGTTPGMDTIRYVVGTTCSATVTHVLKVANCGLGIITAQLPHTTIYPNPANDELNIECASVINEVTVVNTMGQVVLKSVHRSEAVQIGISTLPAGLYCVKINGLQAGTFIKM
jgi:hypothetical protein